MIMKKIVLEFVQFSTDTLDEVKKMLMKIDSPF
jgi:hypothetical protein